MKQIESKGYIEIHCETLEEAREAMAYAHNECEYFGKPVRVFITSAALHGVAYPNDFKFPKRSKKCLN